MYAFLLTVMILDGLLLAAVVLLQAGQGGGLASLGGATTDLVVGGRQAVTLLTKMSWICGGMFLGLALLLSLVAPTRNSASNEVLERIRQSTPAAPPAALPLQTNPESGAANPGGTALPLQPAPAPSSAPGAGAGTAPPSTSAGAKAPAAPAKPGH
ncbi:MAG TPA: preprotein translocase subunit SecG [Gemmatimonadales bacterium]|nr:preprotein translocase subunit SecG [Gemmatimonadales bacterium]